MENKERLGWLLVLDDLYNEEENLEILGDGNLDNLFVQNYISAVTIKTAGNIFIAINRDSKKGIDPENGITAAYSCDAARISAGGDIEILGNSFTGDCDETFDMGSVRSGGILVVEELNAGKVYATEHFVAKTANVDELNCGGDVEAKYIYCEEGVYALGDIKVDCLVCEAPGAHAFCGGKFTGKFMGDSNRLHEHFSDWANLKKYL